MTPAGDRSTDLRSEIDSPGDFGALASRGSAGDRDGADGRADALEPPIAERLQVRIARRQVLKNPRAQSCDLARNRVRVLVGGDQVIPRQSPDPS
jgi:hypothetical protein